MKFEFNWPNLMVSEINTMSDMCNLRRSKVNLDLWDTFIVIVSFG